MAAIKLVIIGMLMLLGAQAQEIGPRCFCDKYATHSFSTLRRTACNRPEGAPTRDWCWEGKCSGDSLLLGERTLGRPGEGPGTKTVPAEVGPKYRSEAACAAAGFVWTPQKCYHEDHPTEPLKRECMHPGTSSIVHAGAHTCAIHTDGSVLDCWGGGDCAAACADMVQEYFKMAVPAGGGGAAAAPA